jgi:hypothetical protein
MTTTIRPATGVGVRVGLVLAALLSLVDLVALVTTEHGGTTGVAVAVGGGVLAVATLAALPAGWRGAGWALRTVAATRLVACLASVPAFFDGGTAEEPVLVAAVTVVLAIVVAVLVLPRRGQA